MRVCGDCANYVKRPFHEDTCSLTGKIVPYLDQRDCFEAKDDININTNEININTKMEEQKKTKVCKVCGRELPIDRFRKNWKSRDGHVDTCEECMRERVKSGLKKAYSDKNSLSDYTDLELKEELLSRGWEVTCTKTMYL